MIKKVSVSGVLNSFVPISRFNKGEAHKIFDEVKENGYGIVVKNNSPTCVLITPEIYEEMMDIIDKYNSMMEFEERMGQKQDNGAEEKDIEEKSSSQEPAS